jgi:hypothetical protein
MRMKGQQLPRNLSTPFSRYHQQDVQLCVRRDHDVSSATAVGHLHRRVKSAM